ncbi:MAG: hypothetical protein A3G24_23690 [Betaproteobacteria bacterium RIFCSPLOWO2_12_FULL_62_13]|nr:MAG: hypothetical protein A3G24_23690 [Betaproteobacteria bacterium RIFCSPLOWO2_12_FULL_62_13]
MLDRALWVTWYDLPAEGRDAYLSWLHGTYIPKLLKHPGFLWAAHYAWEKGVRSASRLRHVDDSTVPTGNDYILLFGAEEAHAFANPIPGKLHAGLPEEDRKMLSLRRGERANIFIEEARTDGPEIKRREGKMAPSPCIQLGSFNAGSPQSEDELLDWYAHCRMPAMRTLPGCLGVRKLVSVSGWAKHGVLYEFLSLAARNEHFPDHEKPNPEMKAWTDRLVPTLIHAPGSPNVACRIWPPVK